VLNAIWVWAIAQPFKGIALRLDFLEIEFILVSSIHIDGKAK